MMARPERRAVGILLPLLLCVGLGACFSASQRSRVSPPTAEVRPRVGNADVTILSQAYFRGRIRYAPM
jgi:hypothetical protein